MLNKKPTLIFMTCGLFLLLDQFLKWQALRDWQNPVLPHKFFGWYPFLNSGMAFSLPAPNWLVAVLSLPIIGLVYYLSGRMYHIGEFRKAWGLAFIFTGALSNLIDRIMYQKTVDYIRLFTGVINVADVLIIAGFVIYIFVKSDCHFEHIRCAQCKLREKSLS